jgi:hypothetical protein
VSPRESRFARNQGLVRAVNDEIAKLPDHWSGDLHIVCECATTGCAQMLHISLGEYQRVRECPGRYLIAPGHPVRQAEYVVDHHDAYEVVKVHAAENCDIETG